MSLGLVCRKCGTTVYYSKKQPIDGCLFCSPGKTFKWSSFTKEAQDKWLEDMNKSGGVHFGTKQFEMTQAEKFAIILIFTNFKFLKLQEKRIMNSRSNNDFLALNIDINFYYICLGRLTAFMEKVLKQRPKDLGYRKIYKYIEKDLSNSLVLRDHFEHLQDRLNSTYPENFRKGQKKHIPFIDSNDFGNVVGDKYTFAGLKYPFISIIKKINILERRLRTWLTSNFPEGNFKAL